MWINTWGQVLSNDIDLLHPPVELERRKHKLKRLVQSPNSFFMVSLKCDFICVCLCSFCCRLCYSLLLIFCVQRRITQTQSQEPSVLFFSCSSVFGLVWCNSFSSCSFPDCSIIKGNGHSGGEFPSTDYPVLQGHSCLQSLHHFPLDCT